MKRLLWSSPAVFFLMVFLSLCVHAAVIGWATRLPGIGLDGLLGSEPISARLVTKGRGGGGKVPRDTYAEPPQQGGQVHAGEGKSPSDGIGGIQTPELKTAEQPVERSVSQQEPIPGETAGTPAGADGKPVVTVASAVAPQPPTSQQVPQAAPAPALLKVSRERFYFEIYWLGVYVGKATLEAEIADGVQRITSRVHSAPVISAFYKVEDFAESTVKGTSPVRFRIKQREGKYRSDKETLFDAGGRVTYFDHLKGIKEEHEVPHKTLFDVMSGFFHLRTRPMQVGEAVLLDIFDSNKFLVTEVNVLRHEKVAFLGGEAETTVVRPVLKSEGLFQRKGEIYIWLTNDDRRIPVRVETKVSIGKVVAELKGMEREP